MTYDENIVKIERELVVMGNEVKNCRKKQQLTQEEVAKRSKISLRNYQNIENNVSIPKISTAIRIADALQVQDLRQLFEV